MSATRKPAKPRRPKGIKTRSAQSNVKPGLGEISKGSIYPVTVFQARMGLTAGRMWDARKAGIEPETFPVGNRRYITGEKAIDYMLKLSEFRPPNRFAEFGATDDGEEVADDDDEPP